MDKLENQYPYRKYEAAREVFNIWRKEIGGVALKGVGQHYERWLDQKSSDYD